MRAVVIAGLLAALLPCAAHADDKCGPLQMVNTIQMIRVPGGNADMVPLNIGGAWRYFLLGTGSPVTSITRDATDDLKLSTDHGYRRLYDINGKMSHDEAKAPVFVLGHMRGDDGRFMILPDGAYLTSHGVDGILALDYLMNYDADMDFGSDTLNFFSPDHCPGGILYWKAPAVAVVPIISFDGHITVPVMLDGHRLLAIIDTGNRNTSLEIGFAQKMFGLTPGDADTPEGKSPDGDPTSKIYTHVFKSLTFGSKADLTLGYKNLTFGDVTVNNPHVFIMQSAIENVFPNIIIGMDVLRKLHIYVASKERKLYISDASEFTPAIAAQQLAQQPPGAMQARFQRMAPLLIAAADKTLATDPKNTAALNTGCYERAALKTDFDAALADCNQALALKPGNDNIMDSKAFLLYQQGKYQDALDLYNQVLAINAQNAASLFMRGYAKGKLGDAAGKDTDVAAAAQIQPDIQQQFQQYDISG